MQCLRWAWLVQSSTGTAVLERSDSETKEATSVFIKDVK